MFIRSVSLLCMVSIGLLSSTSPGVDSLAINQCPTDWIKLGNSCYLFRKWMPLSRDKAVYKCGTHGGGLVSVNDKMESDFLVRWLLRHDRYQQSWYTSGVRDVTHMGVKTIMWQATGQRVNQSLLNSVGHEFSHATGALVYVHTETGYEFGTSDPSEVLPYICEVPLQESYRIIQNERGYDYGLPTMADIKSVDKGPHFVLQPFSTVVVGDPDSATLECVAMGKPPPVYSWWKGENLDVPVTREMDSRYVITNGKLVIKHPDDVKDGDKYQCRVENKYGVIVSDVAQLSFGTLGEFSNVPVAPVRAMAYQGAAVECSAITYNPAVAYQWYKTYASQFVRPRYQKYIFISQNGKLYFSEVTSADEGQYYCIAVLAGRGQHTIGISQAPTRTSLPIPLVVQDQAPLADWGPEIQDEFIAVFPKPPLRGQNVRMECFAYGSAITEFKYTWSRQGKPLPKNSVMLDHNRVLLLRDASLDDQGVYTCSVGRGTSAKDERSIDLKLGSKPYFITPIGDQHVDLGAHFTWHCDIRSNPASTFRWYKNGKPLTSDPEKSIVVVNNVITFLKLDPRMHDGMYQCSATNTHGTTLSEGQLRVLAFAPSFSKTPMEPETRAPMNGNLTLACRPEAAPLAQILWSKDGAELPLISEIYEQRMDGQLFVKNIHEGNEGRYTCRAVNGLGEAEDSTYVTVAEGTAITVAPVDLQVVVNTTAFFDCLATSAPDSDLLYTWHFNGFMIDPRRNPEYTVNQDEASGRPGLYIVGVKARNAGVYECRATTTINEDRRSAFLTVISPPSEPAGVFLDSATVTDTSLVVRWTETSDNNRIIRSYIIQSQSEFEDIWETAVQHIPAYETVVEMEQKRSGNVTGLNPGCGYRFRVMAVNEVGIGPPSLPTAYAQMLSAPPQVAPMHVGGGGGSVGVLTMAWEPLSRTRQGGHGIGYNVFWRKKHASKLKEEQWRTKRLRGDVGRFVSVEGTDNYYLEYEVKVQSFNNAGMGPISSVVTVMSAEDLPASTPTNVMADGYNGTAMEVTWIPVPDTRLYARGKILGYQINYWHEEDDPNLHKMFIRHEGQIDSGIVIGLKSDNFYYFTIQVYNSAGLGPISEFYFQETLHAPAVNYPEEVRVFSARSPYKVEVRWRGVTVFQPESSVQGFVVYYWPAHENHRTAEMKYVRDRLAYRTTIPVDPGVVYALRVSAFSVGGLGAKSVTLYFTLAGKNILIDFNLAQTVESFVSPSAGDTTRTSIILYCILLAYLCSLLL